MPTAATTPPSSWSYVKHFNPTIEVVGEAWPKLFQPDYTEVITKMLQTKAAGALFCLWGGDLDGLHRPGQHLRLFAADRDLRGQHRPTTPRSRR